MSVPVMWLCAAALLLAAEVLTPGGVIMIFFAFGALAMAGIARCVPGLAVAWQLLLFSGLSVASLATLRPVLMRRLGARRTAYSVFDLKGKTAVVVARIVPPESGRIELDGSEWKAVANQPLDPGTVVTVVGHENVTLTVQSKE